VAHGIRLVENLGVYEQYYEAGGYETLRGAYINSQLFGDTSFVTSINMRSKSVPSGITLYQNSPNPFNGTTNINFYLTEPGFVSFSIYDIKGNLIRNLINEQYKTKGEHGVKWDGRNLNNIIVSSGIYFYKLIINRRSVFVKRLVFIK